jgi:hypothetical protein
MKKNTEEIKDIQKDTIKTEEKILKKKKERESKKTKEETSAQEKLIAPIIMVLTVLISYLIFLFKS